MSEKKMPTWVGVLLLIGVWLTIFGIVLLVWTGISIGKISMQGSINLLLGIIILGTSLGFARIYQKRKAVD